jgi:hypothetical protein
MGTTDNFDVPAATSYGLTDQVPINAISTTARGAYATGNQLLSGLAAAVQTTATALSLTKVLHANRIVNVASTAPIAITLPQATGTGDTYRIVISVAATATQHTIKVANATDVMQGYVHCLTTSSDNVIGYATSASSDTITLNGTTTGGLAGSQWEIVDIKTGFFQVIGFDSPTGSTATPFSASVSS